jgi:hypothetical protein
VAAERERQLRHRQLVSPDAGHVESAARRQLADQEAEVLLRRREAAPHTEHEVEVGR